MQTFYINSNSVNPSLRMQLYCDGRYDYNRSLINNALQDSTVKFFMKDTETDLLKIANANAEIVLGETVGCEENYVLQYKWKERDVKTKGTYKAWFEITFNGNISENGVEYPKGNLIVPIQEELIVYVI